MLVKQLSPAQRTAVDEMAAQLTRAGLFKCYESITSSGPDKARVHAEIAKLSAVSDVLEYAVKSGTMPVFFDPKVRQALAAVRIRAKSLVTSTSTRLSTATRAGDVATAKLLGGQLAQLAAVIGEIDLAIGAEQPPAQPARQRR